MSKSRALQVFLNADFRCAHEGLALIAKSHKIDVSKLEIGEYLIFVNTAKDRLKLYAANNVVAYLKLKTGKIDLRTIQLIPQAFNGSGRIDYDAALKEVIDRELARKKTK